MTDLADLTGVPDVPDLSEYAELHAASAFSLLRSGSSVDALVARAAALGLSALALTDYMTLAGVVRFQAACAQHGLHGIVGAELAIADPVLGAGAAPAQFVVLVENTCGYARLCQLLTDANLTTPERPVIPFAALVAAVSSNSDGADGADGSSGLIVLTGGRDGTLSRLLTARHRQQALEVARRYRSVFGPNRLFIELQHHRLPESRLLMQDLAGIAEEVGLRCVATNGVHYATRDDYPLYDLLTCVRLGITVDIPHRERPQNDEARLKSAAETADLFSSLPYGPAALAATTEIAARCDLSLLKALCTAPQVPLPTGETPASQLQRLCEQGLRQRYAHSASVPAAYDILKPDSPQQQQLAHELDVIAQLDLEEFFLCVHQIVAAARSMGIRISGRGSAANSITAYLLGITGVDPIAHHLLFERFLNPDRRGMPDIDLDVQSDRREELIRYVERTYTHDHAAMVANVITYRPRLALRDAAKALGFPLPLVNRLTKHLPHSCDPETQPTTYQADLAQVIAHSPPESLDAATRNRCVDRLPLALSLAARLCGLPRHLSLHNGGMVLTREPLSQLLPVRISTNGVRALEIDKDDVERLGLIKFDLLGLRTLGAIEESLYLIEETTGARPDIDHLPTTPPDPATMRLIRAGQTLAVFQIESPGQWHLLAQTQPCSFDDLVIQTALFRPGPIQAHMVHPYVERRQQHQTHQEHQQRQASQNRQEEQQPQPLHYQREAVQTPWHDAPDDFWTTHPLLGPILRDSEGILLFQEQILEIAHQFSGLTYAEADGFRRAMSHARSPREMEQMRTRFLAGALAHGESSADAERVFEAISHFVGYGFCKSHAAEFARTIYQTAYLKAHYPAQYLAAFLSSQPAGFFPPHVILEEAKRLRIPVLGVDINRSEDRFSVERIGSPGQDGHERWAIRIGLRQIAQIGDELARAILWERRSNTTSTISQVTNTSVDGATSQALPELERQKPEKPQEYPFRSLQDLCTRLRPHGLTWSAAEALVLSGACDSLSPRMERRQRLWHLHELWPLIASVAPTASKRDQGSRKRTKRSLGAEKPAAEQLALTWEETLPHAAQADQPDLSILLVLPALPALPALTGADKALLDYQLLGLSARPHPLRLLRRRLQRRGIRSIADLADVPTGQLTRIAGWVVSAQAPPTAHGMAFLVLEDETGHLPVAVPPRLAAHLHHLLLDLRTSPTHTLIVLGRVERIHWYRSLLACDLRPLAS